VDPAVEVEVADPRLPRGIWSRLRLGHALAGAAHRFRPDAVFAPGNFHIPVLAAFGLFDRSGASIFCKISNPLCRVVRPGAGGWFHRRMMRALMASIDGLVAMSPVLREEAAQVLGPARVVARWEPIFDAESVPSAETLRDPTLIIAAGRLEPQKNFTLAIEAMAHLGRWSDAQLVILGEGSERRRLSRLIQRLGLQERVRLIGHVPDPQQWLRRAACFLMTSRYEGYPAALVEALACNTPVIVTPCSPALSEILPRAGASLIVQPDAGAIAAALEDVLSRPRLQPIDPLLLARHNEARAAESYLDLMDRGVGSRQELRLPNAMPRASHARSRTLTKVRQG
jgi:glycosyltransferase involved in cell wall biosynthesis